MRVIVSIYVNILYINNKEKQVLCEIGEKIAFFVSACKEVLFSYAQIFYFEFNFSE
jgi:hypothetical protein